MRQSCSQGGLGVRSRGNCGGGDGNRALGGRHWGGLAGAPAGANIDECRLISIFILQRCMGSVQRAGSILALRNRAGAQVRAVSAWVRAREHTPSGTQCGDCALALRVSTGNASRGQRS